MTFAVILVGGKQYKVREKDEIQVEKLDIAASENVKIKEVLLISEDDASQMKLGMPYVSGAHVECKVLEHGKAEKIQVFKMKSKKRYSKTQGHRQMFTALKVLKISALEKKEKAAPKEEKVVETEVKEEKSTKKPVSAKPKTVKKAAPKTAKTTKKVKSEK